MQECIPVGTIKSHKVQERKNKLADTANRHLFLQESPGKVWFIVTLSNLQKFQSSHSDVLFFPLSLDSSDMSSLVLTQSLALK